MWHLKHHSREHLLQVNLTSDSLGPKSPIGTWWWVRRAHRGHTFSVALSERASQNLLYLSRYWGYGWRRCLTSSEAMYFSQSGNGQDISMIPSSMLVLIISCIHCLHTPWPQQSRLWGSPADWKQISHKTLKESIDCKVASSESSVEYVKSPGLD